MFSGHVRFGQRLDWTATGPPERLPRALVLHGNPLALRFLRRSLEARSFAVASAGDATTGLQLLLNELLDLDVLVVGLDLPHRDARSLAHLVRGAGGERDLALVVVSNELAPELRAELLALGVDAIADLRDGESALAEVVLGVVAARRRGAQLGRSSGPCSAS